MNAAASKHVTAAVLCAMLALTTRAWAFPGQALAGEARITIVQARALAQHVVSGPIISEELEKEAGGSGLRYTFDIRGSHGVREVGIDAKTGRVLENSSEGSDTQSDSR